MAFQKFASALYPLVVFFALLIQSAFAGPPLFYSCSTTNENSTAVSSDNLIQLLNHLSDKAANTNFGTGTFGSIPDRKYGLALCRGNTGGALCKLCIEKAAVTIRELCSSKRAAMIGYEWCVLKYSDNDFFGQIDRQNKFYVWNPNNVSNPKSFNEDTNKLLSQLVKKALVSSSLPKLYADGEMKLGGSNETLYGMVQCTGDLSSANCEKCLKGIIGELPSCCDGKKGGRVFTGSCNFRYEIYTFIGSVNFMGFYY